MFFEHPYISAALLLGILIYILIIIKLFSDSNK